jgi:hypothetical protein
MTWAAQLAGDTSDLSALAQSLTGTEINVFHDGRDYVLTSDRFTPADDAAVVHQKAESMVALLSGGSRLALDATESIRVGAVYQLHNDGRRDTFIFSEPAVISFRMISPTVRMTYADGTVKEFHPADPIKQWMALALSNDAVAKVLRILSSGTLDWVNLYRILEIIATDVRGFESIVSNGWGTNASIKLFKRTANSPDAVGIDARHGATTTQPPAKPMSISEAQALINSIVHAWLRAKSGKTPP